MPRPDLFEAKVKACRRTYNSKQLSIITSCCKNCLNGECDSRLGWFSDAKNIGKIPTG